MPPRRIVDNQFWTVGALTFALFRTSVSNKRRAIRAPLASGNFAIMTWARTKRSFRHSLIGAPRRRRRRQSKSAVAKALFAAASSICCRGVRSPGQRGKLSPNTGRSSSDMAHLRRCSAKREGGNRMRGPAFGDQPSRPNSFYRDFANGTTFREGPPMAAAIDAPMVSAARRIGSPSRCA
jgi:hypothetical protein